MGIEVMTYLGEDIWAVPYYIDPEQGGEDEHVWLPDWRFSAPEWVAINIPDGATVVWEEKSYRAKVVEYPTGTFYKLSEVS